MEYNIKRFCKAGERNVNGFIFDKESTDMALKNYINKPVILVKKDESYLGGIKETDKVVGYMTGYDDEHIKCFLYEGFIEDGFNPDEYKSLLGIDALHISENNICITNKILKIAIAKR